MKWQLIVSAILQTQETCPKSVIWLVKLAWRVLQECIHNHISNSENIVSKTSHHQKWKWKCPIIRRRNVYMHVRWKSEENLVKNDKVIALKVNSQSEYSMLIKYARKLMVIMLYLKHAIIVYLVKFDRDLMRNTEVMEEKEKTDGLTDWQTDRQTDRVITIGYPH